MRPATTDRITSSARPVSPNQVRPAQRDIVALLIDISACFMTASLFVAHARRTRTVQEVPNEQS